MANINVRIDDKIKKNAEAVFSKIGITPSAAINLFYNQVIRTNSIPFELKADNTIKSNKIILSDYGIELHMVRHGRDEEDKLGGWSDNHLTDKGIIEVKLLKEEIDNDYDLFISSDLNRTKETSLILNEKLNMNIIYDSNFREVNNGILKNMTKKDRDLKYPNLCFSKLKMDQCFPNGESPIEFYERISKAFIKLINENRNKKILLVTHGGVIVVILCILNDIEYSNTLQMAPNTGTMTKVK